MLLTKISFLQVHKNKKRLCLVCVDWCRACRGFWLNLMLKLGIWRNLLVVLLRAFLIKKEKLFDFSLPWIAVSWAVLAYQGVVRDSAGLDRTESRKGDVQVGLCRSPWDSLSCCRSSGVHLEASPAFPRFALLLVTRLTVSLLKIHPRSKGLQAHEQRIVLLPSLAYL